MSCEHPILALDLGIDSDTGKRRLKIFPARYDYNVRMLEERYGLGSIIPLPCGQCSSCKLSKRREWSVRCMLEASLYSDNCFVTLTFDDNNVTRKLQKEPLQKFIHALRDSGVKCRYFACGEYGSKTKRPHYHLILFGYCPDDLQCLGKDSTGEYIYRSKFLESIWKKGFVSVGDVTSQSAGYVAGYANKKLGDNSSFLIMSTRPGIGADYFTAHFKDIYVNDNIIVKNGFVASVPRYCDKLAEASGVDLTDYKARRLETAKLTLNDAMIKRCIIHREELWRANGLNMNDKLRRLKRGL